MTSKTLISLKHEQKFKNSIIKCQHGTDMLRKVIEQNCRGGQKLKTPSKHLCPNEIFIFVRQLISSTVLRFEGKTTLSSGKGDHKRAFGFNQTRSRLSPWLFHPCSDPPELRMFRLNLGLAGLAARSLSV